jgi:integrase
MTEDMPRKLPLHVVKETNRHGTVVFYFRVGKGERTRLRGIPGSKEFKAAYDAVMRGMPLQEADVVVKARSIRWLIDRYMESAHWAGLSDATRKQQGLFFKQIVAVSGSENCRDVTARDVRDALESRKATPALANNVLKALKGLFRWALVNEHVDIDPTADVQGLRHKTMGFPVWTEADVIRFCEKWPIGTPERLAFELMVHSGIRRSDIHRAGRQHLSGNIFSMRTAKTNTQITVELPERLLHIIAQTKSSGLHFIENAHGRPFTKESFGNWFGDRCRKAGVEKNAHGIRKLSATLAANGGATTHELMAQYGWKNVQQAETYTKGADRVRLGVKTSRVVAEQVEAIQTPHLTPGAGLKPKTKKKSNT